MGTDGLDPAHGLDRKRATLGREAAPAHTGAKPADALEQPCAQILTVAGVEQQRAV
jgi:hypothetical protein